MSQTQTVTVAISNINNSPKNNVFTSVTATLGSQNGHFSVNTQTINIGTLPTGTVTATWQITGVSEGSDLLLISASATNTHENLRFQDSYSPSPSISIAFNPNWTPTSSPVPTPTPTPSPSSTSNPTVINAPTPTQTPKPTPPPSSTTPITQPLPNSTFSTPQPEKDTETPNPTMPHDPLNSTLLYIHPPLAITGYVFVFLFALLVFKNNYFERRITKMVGMCVWLFIFLGLLTGMLWAQLALGSYWSWDPKEIMTLILFLTVSAGQLLYFDKKNTATKWLALIACTLVILTGLTGFITA